MLIASVFIKIHRPENSKGNLTIFGSSRNLLPV